MKVRTKLRINKVFLVSIQIMIDKGLDSQGYWEWALKYVEDVKERDYNTLSIKQRNLLTNIKMNLTKEGLL